MNLSKIYFINPYGELCSYTHKGPIQGIIKIKNVHYFYVND